MGEQRTPPKDVQHDRVTCLSMAGEHKNDQLVKQKKNDIPDSGLHKDKQWDSFTLLLLLPWGQKDMSARTSVQCIAF